MKKTFKKIYIEITNCCNLSCSFCSKTSKPKRTMTIEEFKNIISKIKSYTDYIYLHVKGEPLLHKDLKEFLKIAEENDLKVNLTTNGTLFSQRVDDLKNSKALKKVNFSLHSENNYPNYFENIFQSVDKLPKDSGNVVISLPSKSSWLRFERFPISFGTSFILLSVGTKINVTS